VGQFIGKGEANPTQAVPMKPNPLMVETKSKRLQLLVQPSLHRKLKAIATAKQTSLNDLIHTILTDYTEE